MSSLGMKQFTRHFMNIRWWHFRSEPTKLVHWRSRVNNTQLIGWTTQSTPIWIKPIKRESTLHGYLKEIWHNRRRAILFGPTFVLVSIIGRRIQGWPKRESVADFAQDVESKCLFLIATLASASQSWWHQRDDIRLGRAHNKYASKSLITIRSDYIMLTSLLLICLTYIARASGLSLFEYFRNLSWWIIWAMQTRFVGWRWERGRRRRSVDGDMRQRLFTWSKTCKFNSLLSCVKKAFSMRLEAVLLRKNKKQKLLKIILINQNLFVYRQ